MSLDQSPIRLCILYEFKRNTSAIEATRIICFVYRNEALRVRTCQRYFGEFHCGCISFVDSSQSDRSNSVNVQVIKHLHELGSILKHCQWFPLSLIASHLNSRVAFDGD
ncbi:uncharacterized protein LOC115227863 [Octopus sinensis]|uniref:Uncharacterized protein LOC115227863 n=1 Tax=Octopus sinensis TaxID=2607531 RepID=A0A6P7U0D5_9MOLL|nr:uncharacterized protein LOC115227863 [Octopus sinensis]